jgi:hypothetical protein
MLNILAMEMNYVGNSVPLTIGVSVTCLVLGIVLVVRKKNIVNSNPNLFRLGMILMALSVFHGMSFPAVTLGLIIAALVAGGILITFYTKFVHIYIFFMGISLIVISLPFVAMVLGTLGIILLLIINGGHFGP